MRPSAKREQLFLGSHPSLPKVAGANYSSEKSQAYAARKGLPYKRPAPSGTSAKCSASDSPALGPFLAHSASVLVGQSWRHGRLSRLLSIHATGSASLRDKRRVQLALVLSKMGSLHP